MDSVEQLKAIIEQLLKYIEIPEEKLEDRLRHRADQIAKMRETVKAAKRAIQPPGKGWKAIF